MKNQIRPAVVSFLMLTVVTGILYPAAVTVMAKIFFPWQAEGSMIAADNKTVGSELIGQPFSDAKYFWSRPSATTPMPYNAASSGGSNLGPTNPALADAVRQRINALKAADPSNEAEIPVDLVTASGSGLDPHISIEAARYQMARVARVRQIPAVEVERLIQQNTEGYTLGVLGEPRVNVLKLNLALDHRAYDH
jgi:potassium-transporting ATPase KdpC subunit